MKPHSFLLIMLLGIACHTHAQTVTNVRFEQVNKQVKITYTLDKQADISVSVSEDGGTTWHAPLKKVSGDVGKQVQPGSKTIYWDVLAEYDQFVGTNICFKVTPEGGENLTFTVNGVSFTMVYVEGGTFTMGATPEQGSDAYDDEKPAHQVTLSDFYIGQYEVTQKLWQIIMGTTVSQQRDKDEPSNPLYGAGNNYPMYYISWHECMEFINKLNSLLSRQLGGKRFALPTEAQWEYAARGGRKSKGYKYAGSNTLTEVGWYGDNSGKSIHPVGQKLPNELGLFDMSGNLNEWCFDMFGHYPHYSFSDPTGPSSGEYGVMRGGDALLSIPEFCRVSMRHQFKHTNRYYCVGLRLVLLIPNK